jgi:hypothetical protein
MFDWDTGFAEELRRSPADWQPRGQPKQHSFSGDQLMIERYGSRVVAEMIRQTVPAMDPSDPRGLDDSVDAP